MPAVSVIVPLRDAAAFVHSAIESILHQTDVDLEVVVIDDGSTDGSPEVVKRIHDARVRMVPGPRQGVSAALNAGLAAARGAIIARCDADDLFPRNRLAWQVAWLEGHSAFGGVCGSFATIDPRGRLVTKMNCGQESQEITEELRGGHTRTHLGTFAIRADHLRTLGGFRTYFVTGEDIDLSLRLPSTCRIMYEPRIAYFYRLHGTSLTHTQSDSHRKFFEQAARDFCRQRAETGSDDLDRGQAPEPPADPRGRPQQSDAHVQGMLLGRAWREHGEGRRLAALRTGLRACFTCPGELNAWKSLVALALKHRTPGPPSEGNN